MSQPLYYTHEGGTESFGQEVREHIQTGSPVFILADENTLQHCLPVLESFFTFPVPYHILEIRSGEMYKNLDTCRKLWSHLSSMGADRHSVLINLGGGVVCDLGGFVASVYQRGISFFNIPTTLLAQVDASIGGKTGVDLDDLKNQVGTFSLPVSTLIHSGFLRTLSPVHIRSGFAEIIKIGLVADASLWDSIIEAEGAMTYEDWIRTAIQLKQEVVAADFREEGRRKILNFGHTLGHALESLHLELETPLQHGDAVAAGMIMASWLSHSLCGFPEDELKRISGFLLKHFPIISYGPNDIPRLLQLARHDKKNKGGIIQFTLLKATGEGIINQEVSPDLLEKALAYYLRITQSYRSDKHAT